MQDNANRGAFSDKNKMFAENDKFIKNDFEKDSLSDLFGNPNFLAIGIITCFIILFTICKFEYSYKNLALY